MIIWNKKRYGTDDSQKRGGRWTISNGHLRFDVHWTIDGSINKQLARHEGPEHYIVSPKEAEEYANKIVDALNQLQITV